MSDVVPDHRILDTDEVDLLALRRVLREAELRATERTEDVTNEDAVREIALAADRRVSGQLGRLAAEGCARFDGEQRVSSEYRMAKERRYSMYAMHPDTAEQVIKALEFLIERQGPRLRFRTRPCRIETKTVRNERGSIEAGAAAGSEGEEQDG